ncbi:cold shock domain-containing protein [Novosphingobium fluoreni]|uniref:cold-shock protein n=1 Tax=Novosphingobium fluoreni TaxID=1391222 RepID=UPI001620AC95
MERFDQARGFGFMDVPMLRDSAFLHVSILEQEAFEEITEGDEIVCDVTRGDKGFCRRRHAHLAGLRPPGYSGFAHHYRLWTCNGFVPVTSLIKPPWLRRRAG